MTVTVPQVAMAIIPDVDLVDAGENWPLISDGRENGTFTSDDIAAAIAALDDPSIRSPRLKFSAHGSTGGGLDDGTWGRLPKMWSKAEGMTLAADFVGVPLWLAQVLPSAWASRSIEGRRNVTSDIGRTHALVIDAVTLLGVTLPAISTLDEVRAVWSARTFAEARVTLQEDPMPTTAASTPVAASARTPVAVAASTTTEDIRRAYYDDQPNGSWWWIREIELEPLAVIVSDDEEGLWRVAVTVTGDAITFGTPAAVHVEYVPVAPAESTTSASRAAVGAIVFASRSESRQGVATMDVAALRTRLNLAADVTDDEVLAAADAALAARPEPTTATPPGPPASTTATAPTPPASTTAVVTPITPPATTTDVDDGSTRISTAVLEQLQADAALGVAASRRQATDDQDRFIDRHRARLGPASNPNAARLEANWRREFARNPGEAEALAASHAIIAPSTTEAGHGAGSEDDAAGAAGWTPAELAAFPELRPQGGK